MGHATRLSVSSDMLSSKNLDLFPQDFLGGSTVVVLMSRRACNAVFSHCSESESLFGRGSLNTHKTFQLVF